MDLATSLENVTVLGAGGKMGSGIALLLAVEMAKRRLDPANRGRGYRLHLVDTSAEALDGIPGYLRAQARKIGEKTTVALRELYAEREDLVENGEIIQAFVDEVLDGVRLATDAAAAKDSKLVFEAIIENPEIKVKVYRDLKKICGEEAFFLTNTSSVPIRLIDEEAGLDGRIIGYHFYNPPPVQKLVELITTPATKPGLVALSEELGKVLRKKLIPANDIAGFIGNGHFMRDGLHAIAEVEKLAKDRPFTEAVYMMDKVSRDFLVRPMGIFQLIDYVGLDVFKAILSVMKPNVPDPSLHSELVDKLVAAGVKGGQYPSGAQKDGFLKYGKKGPEGVYDPEKGDYLAYDPAWCARLDETLGAPPASWQPWKKLARNKQAGELLATYFADLHALVTPGAKLAAAYLKRSKEIGEKLVADGVANTTEDVNGVLQNGFYHIYGPINDYVQA